MPTPWRWDCWFPIVILGALGLSREQGVGFLILQVCESPGRGGPWAGLGLCKPETSLGVTSRGTLPLGWCWEINTLPH